MIDVIYIIGTIAFFALMLAYVSFCDHLASPDGTSGGAEEVGHDR